MKEFHGKKLYGTATVGTKGQIVIPADAREELGIEPGDRMYIAGSPEKKVLFCLKEEQLQRLIDQLTEGAQDARDYMRKLKRRE